jgi:cytochrome oxidase Cu insertion factor (SCO1/SenC/PrrC family)
MNIAEQPPQSRHSISSHNDAEAYNYDRFHPRTLAKDAELVRHPEGPHLGEAAPDFVLQDTEGQEWRLSDLRGHPAVLIIGSGTCPLTQGVCLVCRRFTTNTETAAHG